MGHSGLAGATSSGFSCLRSIPQSHRRVLTSFESFLVPVGPTGAAQSKRDQLQIPDLCQYGPAQRALMQKCILTLQTSTLATLRCGKPFK